jgi:hypothetical protein
MRKQRAIEMLGGTIQSAATCIGNGSSESVRVWPDPVNPVIRDRVLAGIVRMHAARAMGLTLQEFHESKQAHEALEEALAASTGYLQHIGNHAAERFKSTSLAPAA